MYASQTKRVDRKGDEERIGEKGRKREGIEKGEDIDY